MTVAALMSLRRREANREIEEIRVSQLLIALASAYKTLTVLNKFRKKGR